MAITQTKAAPSIPSKIIGGRCTQVLPDPTKGRRIYHHVFARAGNLNNLKDGSPRHDNQPL
jgi:hypothetical protein